MFEVRRQIAPTRSRRSHLTFASPTGAFLAAVIPKESRTRFLGSESGYRTCCSARVQIELTRLLAVINVCKTLAATPGPTFSLTLVSMGHIRYSFVLMGSIKILCEFLENPSNRFFSG